MSQPPLPPPAPISEASAMGLLTQRNFWNNLIEKAFIALIAWFLFSMTQDVKTMANSIHQLNLQMASVLEKVSNQDQRIKEVKSDVDFLQKQYILRPPGGR